MTKANAYIENSDRVDDSKKLLDARVQRLLTCVERDATDIQPWVEKQAFYRWVRHGAGDPGRRGVANPWVGASDLFMPLPEVYCNQVMAPYMNLLHGGPRHVRMVPANAEGWRNRAAAELVMESWARGGGKHHQRDLRRQTAYMIHNLTQTGRGVLHVRYAYETRVESHRLMRDRLPGILGKLVIVPDITEQQRQLMQSAVQAINSPDVLAFFGSQEPVQPLSKALFKQYYDRIKRAVIQLYELDYEDEIDTVACKDLMDYFAAGTPEKEVVVRMRAVTQDGPRLENVNLEDLVVPVGAKTDFSMLERLCHKIHMTRSQAASMADEDDWTNADEALESASLDDGLQPNGLQPSNPLRVEQLERTLSRQNAATGEEEDHVTFLKIWSYEPIEGVEDEDSWKKPGPRQLCCTIVEPNSRKAVYSAVVEGELPYYCLTLEANSDDFFDSQGIAEKLRDVTAHVNALYRGYENAVTLVTFPTYQAKRSAYTDIEGFEIAPGDVVPVANPGDIQQFPMNVNLFPLDKLLSNLMQWPERLIGGIDHQLGGEEPRERPRTATEISKMDSARQRILGVRALVFLDDYAKALQGVYRMLLRYGPDRLFIHAEGSVPTRVSMAQLRGDFTVRPMAAVGDLDPQMRYQRAMARLQMLMQSKQMIDGDLTRKADVMQALVDVFDADDPMATQALLPMRSPEEQQSLMKIQQQEALRLQGLRETADALDANVEINNPQVLLALLRELKSISPFGDFQRLRLVADEAKNRAMGTMAALNGGPR